MAEQKPATLRDVLGAVPGYEAGQYFNESEIRWIRSTFGGNEMGIRTMRKLFLATAFDPELPIEEMTSDAWVVDKDFAQMPNEQIKTVVLARQDAIKMIMNGLIRTKVIANQAELTPEQIDAQRKANSSK